MTCYIMALLLLSDYYLIKFTLYNFNFISHKQLTGETRIALITSTLKDLNAFPLHRNNNNNRHYYYFFKHIALLLKNDVNLKLGKPTD